MEFTKLLRHMPHRNEIQVINRFIEGLGEPLASQIENLIPKTLAEALEKGLGFRTMSSTHSQNYESKTSQYKDSLLK